jgi:putative tricarboxylic transport membrane protein
MRRTTLAFTAVVVALSTSGCDMLMDSGGTIGPFPSRTVELMVPAAAGGGWDLTARSIQQVIHADNLVGEPVEVFNKPGAGGTIGLAELIAKGRKDPHQLMITGLVMIGALEQNGAGVDLTQVTPIATVTAESEAIVVPATSPYQDLRQLMTAFAKDPAAIKWGGGTAGGTDHLLVGMLASAGAVPPDKIRYIGYSGGGEAKAGLLSGDVSVGVSGVSEFEGLISAGKVRLLAVSAPASIAVSGRPAPTIRDAGYPVELMNWRAIVAPPAIPEADRQALISLLDKVHDSPRWKEVLAKQGWSDFYKTGQEAGDFLRSETARVKELVAKLGVT